MTTTVIIVVLALAWLGAIAYIFQLRSKVESLEKENNNTQLNQVLEFHKMFGHPVESKPTLPPRELMEFRLRFLREEVDEMEEAYNNNDIVGIADALGDIGYVLYGTVLVTGLQDDFKNITDEIHRSNMTKACDTVELASETALYYKQKQPDFTFNIEKKEGKWIVVRNDGKIVKSLEYSEADLRSIIYGPETVDLDYMGT